MQNWNFSPLSTGNNLNVKVDDFATVLHQLAKEVGRESSPAFSVREISPPPILCPHADSPVRFMPLDKKCSGSTVEGLSRIWTGDQHWTFVDFASFQGEDFAYAVYRALLHRVPSKRLIRAAESWSPEERFLILLEADRKARSVGGLGKLVGLSGSRKLYRALRTSQKLKIKPLSSMLRMLINARARRLFASKRDVLTQRQLILSALNLLSRRG